MKYEHTVDSNNTAVDTTAVSNEDAPVARSVTIQEKERGIKKLPNIFRRVRIKQQRRKLFILPLKCDSPSESRKLTPRFTCFSCC